MLKLLRFPFPLLLLFFLHNPTTSAQSPAPQSGPTNITGILQKAGQFTTLIRLLQSTQVGDQINTQLNNSNQGLTIFAPTDNAFSNLKSGMLNSLTDQQKVQLVQFHILPSLTSISNFQTVSNPLRTQAGNSNNGQFPLNVTSSGNQVNITTGVVNATVANTIYSDSQLAVYQVDQVLVPLDFVKSSSSSPAPAPSKAEKDGTTLNGPSSDASVDSSASMALIQHSVTLFSFGGVAVVTAAFSLWL